MKASWKKNYDKVIITKEDGEQVPTSELQPEVDNGETWTKDSAKGQKHLAEDWVEYQKKPGATQTAGATFATWAFSGSRNAAQALTADLGDDEAVKKRYSLQEKGVAPDKANKTKFESGGSYGKVAIPTETLADGHKEYGNRPIVLLPNDHTN